MKSLKFPFIVSSNFQSPNRNWYLVYGYAKSYNDNDKKKYVIAIRLDNGLIYSIYLQFARFKSILDPE